MKVTALGRFAIVGLLVLPATAAPGDEQVALTKLPTPVKQALTRAIPGARWSGATKESDGPVVQYEVEGTDGDGDDVSVTIDAAGSVMEVCVEVDLSEVPRVVKDALRAKLPGIKVREVMSAARSGRVVGYRFDARRAGDDLDVFVSADGRQVEVDD